MARIAISFECYSIINDLCRLRAWRGTACIFRRIDGVGVALAVRFTALLQNAAASRIFVKKFGFFEDISVIFFINSADLLETF
jgi:hypothetical protein